MSSGKEALPVFLGHFCHCDIEWLATGVQQVGASRAQVDVCVVVNEWVALSHIPLHAVECAVLGDLQQQHIVSAVQQPFALLSQQANIGEVPRSSQGDCSTSRGPYMELDSSNMHQIRPGLLHCSSVGASIRLLGKHQKQDVHLTQAEVGGCAPATAVTRLLEQLSWCHPRWSAW